LPDTTLDELSHPDAFAHASLVTRLRRFSAEVLGGFVLVFVSCGGAVVGALAPATVTSTGRAAAMGLAIMCMTYVLGDVSGAHFNPAVTLAFAARRVFPWYRVPLYWLAQVSGAFLGQLFGDVAHLGATEPRFGAARGFSFEVALTFFRVLVTLGTATRHRVVGANAAIATGGADAMCAAFARPVSGASMNPARSLAPAILSGHTTFLWIYLTAPFVGALLAVAAMFVVHPHRRPHEKDVAGGERE
jgi:aquaporin Z